MKYEIKDGNRKRINEMQDTTQTSAETKIIILMMHLCI